MKWGGSIAIGAGEGLEGRRGKQLNEVGSLGNSTRDTLEKMVDILAEGKEFSDEVIEVLPSIFRNSSHTINHWNFFSILHVKKKFKYTQKIHTRRLMYNIYLNLIIITDATSRGYFGNEADQLIENAHKQLISNLTKLEKINF